MTENVFQRDCAKRRQVDSSWRHRLTSVAVLFCWLPWIMYHGRQNPSSFRQLFEKYLPDSWLLTRIWFTKQRKQKHKAKFAVELLWFPHYSFIALQTDRHSGSYFSITLRRKSLAIFTLLAHFSFSVSTHFHFTSSVSCLQKHLPFVSSKTVCVFTLSSDMSATQWGKVDMVRLNCET